MGDDRGFQCSSGKEKGFIYLVIGFVWSVDVLVNRLDHLTSGAFYSKYLVGG